MSFSTSDLRNLFRETVQTVSVRLKIVEKVTNMTRSDDFNSVLTRMATELRIIRKTLKNMPGGKLSVSVEHGGLSFYRITYGKEKAAKRRINRNERMVYKLANKAYLEEKAERLAYNIKCFEKCEKKLQSLDPQDIIVSLPKNYDRLDYARVLDPESSASQLSWPNPSRDPDVYPVEAALYITDMDQDEWASMAYCENTKEIHNKTHRSNRGILCRSKGEGSILDLLDDMKLRYHYDETVLVDHCRISPDYIIMRSDGKLFYLEHRGWNGPEYDNHNMWKDNQYHAAGIVLGRNYLITFDKPDGSADTELIRRQLENMLQID